MKNILLTGLLLFAFVLNIQAQQGKGFGFKGGLNYNANGNYFQSIDSNAKNPERNVGFHFGLFGKVGFGDKIFIKPELVFTSTKSDYDDASFKMQKLDVPLLVGVKFLKYFNAFGGPSLQYIIDTEFDGVAIDEVKNEFTVGLNFGVGVNIYKVGVDLRYERGFSKNEATFIGDNGVDISRVDTRPDQLILSVSLLL